MNLRFSQLLHNLQDYCDFFSRSFLLVYGSRVRGTIRRDRHSATGAPLHYTRGTRDTGAVLRTDLLPFPAWRRCCALTRRRCLHSARRGRASPSPSLPSFLLARPRHLLLTSHQSPLSSALRSLHEPGIFHFFSPTTRLLHMHAQSRVTRVIRAFLHNVCVTFEENMLFPISLSRGLSAVTQL